MNVDYEILTAETVPAYLDRTPQFAGRVDTSTLEVHEVGDGNLNLVFVCRDANGAGICLKQALPWVRLVGEAWPLTPTRVLAEARGLQVGNDLAPGSMPQMYGLDADQYVVAMENLVGWKMLRSELNAGVSYAGIENRIGDYVGRLAAGTSLFGTEQGEIKSLVADAVNPELCRITEDLVFTEPYFDVENNSFNEVLTADIEDLRADRALRREVSALKWDFMTRAEMLLHGDLHTGSVMVRHGADGAECRVIDPEFCFYGPVGFDLGAFIGNVMIARVRAAVLDRPSDYQQWLAECGVNFWDSFESTIRSLWPERLDDTWPDEFIDWWLQRAQRDAIGYAGAKAIRRIVGLAKVTDIEELPHDEHVRAVRMVLEIARRWIIERGSLGTIAEANRVTDDVIAGVGS